MTSYSGIFLRDALGEDNTLPRADAGTTTSPDIINAGPTAVADPQTDFGDSYDRHLGTELTFGSRNYVYIRGKNYAADNVVGSAALYWCYATQLNTPSSWQPLTTASGANASPLGADADAVAVTATPFIWSPAQSSNPLVLIAAVSDAENLNPVPAYMKASNPEPFAEWQADQGGVSALQFAPPPPPVAKATYSFSGLLVLDNSDELPLTFNVLVNDGVVGDHIACALDAKDVSGNPMGLSSTQITQSGMTAGFQATVPASFTSHFTFDYSAQDLTDPPTPTLTLQVTKVVSSGGGSDDPFNPGGGNTKVVVVAQFTMTTGVPS